MLTEAFPMRRQQRLAPGQAHLLATERTELIGNRLHLDEREFKWVRRRGMCFTVDAIQIAQIRDGPDAALGDPADIAQRVSPLEIASLRRFVSHRASPMNQLSQRKSAFDTGPSTTCGIE